MNKESDNNNESPLWFDKNTPILRYRKFRVLFGLSMVLAALWSAHTADIFPLPQSSAPIGVDGIKWIGVLATIILLSVVSVILKGVEWFERGVPLLRLRTVIVFVGYLSISILVSKGLTKQFVLYALMNGVFITVAFETYSRPLIPESIDPERLDDHMTSWWRFVQIFVTGSVALLVGIALQFFLNNFSRVTAILMIGVVPLVAILSILLYLGWKHILIEHEIKSG